MAAGEAAAAAGMAIYTGNEDAKDLWIRDNEVLDQIAADRTATRSIARGGTGASDAESARTALGFPALGSGNQMPPNAIAVANAQQQLTTATPTLAGHAASKGYVDAMAGTGWNGGTVTGQIYLANAFPASSGYTVCYINGDGRISRNASALRFKKYVSRVDPLNLGDIFPDLVRYKIRSLEAADGTKSRSDEAWHYGHIADWLGEDPDLQPFVIYETEEDGFTLARDSFGLPVPLSIDFIALLLAQTAQLKAKHDALEARLAVLEGKIA